MFRDASGTVWGTICGVKDQTQVVCLQDKCLPCNTISLASFYLQDNELISRYASLYLLSILN